jgi:oxygen-independent coproporphyrinogen-3 oxidase
VRALLPLDSHAEITLEANPGSAETEKFRAFRAAGINRLSLGVQSFGGDFLRALGRVHDEREARAAVEMALRHFDNVNLDIMYGLPGQGVAAARDDIRTALAFRPPHLSAYHLTLEPNTLFYRYPPALPGDDSCAAMQDAVEEELAAAGYEHYEVSAFAASGAQCRHNLNYWRYGDYLGIGAGAHSKISFPDRILRQMRPRQPRAYMEAAGKGQAVQEEYPVAVADLGFEFMMNALRLSRGVPPALLRERTGLAPAALEQPLAAATRRGFIERDGQRIAPTALGRRFLNDLLQLFLPA